MESTDCLNSLSKNLEELKSKEKVDKEILKRMAGDFMHISPHVAPRLQKTFSKNTSESRTVLEGLIDRVDLSDKQLLNSLLKLYLSYGYFRMAQISYSIDGWDEDIVLSFEKSAKWYDLTPLLPPAGDIGWKNMLNHCSVLEEKRLFETTLKLLTQKLHFYAIILTIDRFQDSRYVVQRSGEKVAKKLVGLIIDFANNDNYLTGVNSTLFKLLQPFTDAEEQTAIIEICVQDRFKEVANGNSATIAIQDLVENVVMTKTDLQEVLIVKLLEHLKVNLIRRKRRHSTDPDVGDVSLESMIGSLTKSINLNGIFEDLDRISLSPKNIQITYLQEWLRFLNSTLTGRAITPTTATMITALCSILVATTCDMIDREIICEICDLMTKTVECSELRVEKYFKNCGSEFIMNLTKCLADKTSLLNQFNTPIASFYESYFAKFMRLSTVKKDEASKFDEYINFICDRECHLLLYIYIKELSNYSTSSKISELYKTQSRAIFNKMYKFVKRNRLTKDDDTPTVEILACILTLALAWKDEETLELYGELTHGLFDSMRTRISDLTKLVETGEQYQRDISDQHIARLMTLYVDNKDSIEPYLCYDLLADVRNNLIRKKSNDSSLWKDKKKSIYEALKGKLDSFESEKAVDKLNSNWRYRTNLANGQVEDSCTEKIYLQILDKVTAVVLNSCNLVIYESILDDVIAELEGCDVSDHHATIYLLSMVESLITKDAKKLSLFEDRLQRISCCLIRIHAFTQIGGHKISRSIQCCTYSRCIRIYTSIFRTLGTTSWLTDAMQICVSLDITDYAKNGTSLYTQVANSICELLKAVCVGKRNKDTIHSIMPIFLTMISVLISSLIIASGSIEVSELERLAQDIGRLMNNLSRLESNLVEYAPYLISSYIKSSQKATCVASVKSHLDEGIYRIFNLIDAYQKDRQEEIMLAQRKTQAGRASGSLLEMIHARLDQASREIFRNMHENYNKFHRYQGKC